MKMKIVFVAAFWSILQLAYAGKEADESRAFLYTELCHTIATQEEANFHKFRKSGMTIEDVEKIQGIPKTELDEQLADYSRTAMQQNSGKQAYDAVLRRCLYFNRNRISN